MSYQVLARKWRPKRFAEMVGQEHVVRALSNALEQKRLHHAYLFTGTRGVGKTTLARVLAKSLNCEKGVSSTPCGACSACREIDEGRFVDLIEVDAASRTKVEDTRELLENVQYAPTRGRYKVYLIDEVHMLSGHSFNALLKTLEEPPPHVKFLLATTDPQKLPVTILSRCLQFNLKRLPVELIKQRLSDILGAEKIDGEPAALAAIAPHETQIEAAAKRQRVSGHAHVPVADLVAVLRGVKRVTERRARRQWNAAFLPVLLPVGFELQRPFNPGAGAAPVGEAEFNRAPGGFVAQHGLEHAGPGGEYFHGFSVKATRQVKPAYLVRQDLGQPQADAVRGGFPGCDAGLRVGRVPGFRRRGDGRAEQQAGNDFSCRRRHGAAD